MPVYRDAGGVRHHWILITGRLAPTIAMTTGISLGCITASNNLQHHAALLVAINPLPSSMTWIGASSPSRRWVALRHAGLKRRSSPVGTWCWACGSSSFKDFVRIRRTPIYLLGESFDTRACFEFKPLGRLSGGSLYCRPQAGSWIFTPRPSAEPRRTPPTMTIPGRSTEAPTPSTRKSPWDLPDFPLNRQRPGTSDASSNPRSAEQEREHQTASPATLNITAAHEFRYGELPNGLPRGAALFKSRRLPATQALQQTYQPR